jgi:hypothetical protein
MPAREIRKSFRVERHEEFDTLGVRPLDMPHADPLSGMAAAHDMLEHFPGDDGSIADEFQALGAAIYVRGIPGYFASGRGNPDAAENIGSDFEELYRHWAHEGFRLTDPGRTQALSCERAEKILQAAVNYGFKRVRYNSGDMAECRGFISKHARRCIVGWMRKGYRRAAKRYTHTQDWRVCWTFQLIEARVDKLLAMASEGDQLDVVCIPSEERVVCSLADYGFDSRTSD